VFERDHHTCVVCGEIAGEHYDDRPNGSTVRLTVGHRVPGERLGGASLDDLQTECARCNEPVRDLVPNPETFEEVLPAVRSLRSADLKLLQSWLAAGRRSRREVDIVFGRVRRLNQHERRRMLDRIALMLGK
jgi:5-methylcytosine-specific restriction endonuclease McrA